MAIKRYSPLGPHLAASAKESASSTTRAGSPPPGFFSSLVSSLSSASASLARFAKNCPIGRLAFPTISNPVRLSFSSEIGSRLFSVSDVSRFNPTIAAAVSAFCPASSRMVIVRLLAPHTSHKHADHCITNPSHSWVASFEAADVNRLAGTVQGNSGLHSKVNPQPRLCSANRTLSIATWDPNDHADPPSLSVHIIHRQNKCRRNIPDPVPLTPSSVPATALGHYVPTKRTRRILMLSSCHSFLEFLLMLGYADV